MRTYSVSGTYLQATAVFLPVHDAVLDRVSKLAQFVLSHQGSAAEQ